MIFMRGPQHRGGRAARGRLQEARNRPWQGSQCCGTAVAEKLGDLQWPRGPVSCDDVSQVQFGVVRVAEAQCPVTTHHRPNLTQVRLLLVTRVPLEAQAGLSEAHPSWTAL